MSHIPFFNRGGYGTDELRCPYCCQPLTDFALTCACGAYQWNTRTWIHPDYPDWRNPKHGYPPDFDTEWQLMMEEFTQRAAEGYKYDLGSNYFIHKKCLKPPVPIQHGYEMNHATGVWQKRIPRYKPGKGFWPKEQQITKKGLDQFFT
jgi:hypothetical protein